MITANELELSYIAGLIDGEGTIAVNFDNELGLRLIMYFGSTNKEVVAWVKSKLGTGGYTEYRKENLGENNKPFYSCYWGSKKSLEILKAIKPYLIIKKEHAEVALQYPMVASSKGISKEEEEMRAWCWMRLKELNQKGVK